MHDLKAKILSAPDLPRKPIEVPEWDCPEGTLSIRVMSGEERESFESFLLHHQNGDGNIDPRGVRCKLLVLTLADADGKRIFDDEDDEELAKKSSKVISRLAEIAQEVNGIAPKSVEVLEKNSESGPSAASTSA